MLIVRRDGDNHQTKAEEDVMLNCGPHGFHNYGYEVSASFVFFFFLYTIWKVTIFIGRDYLSVCNFEEEKNFIVFYS